MRRSSLIAVVAVLFGGFGCQGDGGTGEPVGGEARSSIRFPGPHAARTARVTKHTDGDTLWLSGLGKVRFIGVDTPEVFGGLECFGRRASAFVKRVAPIGSRLRYRVGVGERDRYGRALAYLWLPDGRMLNGLLVELGYAVALTVPPNVEYADLFRSAAARARRQARGLWASRKCSRDVVSP